MNMIQRIELLQISSLRPYDQFVLDEARRRMQRSAYLSLRHLSCDFQHGMLTIRGEVPTYYLKQLAQTVVGTLEGVREIKNLVHVVLPGSRPRRPR